MIIDIHYHMIPQLGFSASKAVARWPFFQSRKLGLDIDFNTLVEEVKNTFADPTGEKLIERMDEALHQRNHTKYYRLQMEFHDVIINACGNERLIDLLSSLKGRFIKQAYSAEREDDIYRISLKINNEHRKIVDLLENKDAKGVEKYLREVHWVHTYARLDSDTD